MKPLHHLPREWLGNWAALADSCTLELVRDGLRLQWAKDPPPHLYSQPSEICPESTALAASLLLSGAMREVPPVCRQRPYFGAQEGPSGEPMAARIRPQARQHIPFNNLFPTPNAAGDRTADQAPILGNFNRLIVGLLL